MKTKLFVFSASFALLLGMALVPAKAAVKADAATGWDYTNPPVAGEVAPDSYFGNAWHNDVGSKRLNDRAVMITSTSNWGQRGKIIGDRKFDVASFSISLDLSQLLPQTGLMLNFGSPGSYCDTSFLSVDIIVGQADKNYMVVVSNSVHNIAIPGFTDGMDWADDANFTGVSVDTTDDRIKLDFIKTSNDTSTIVINDSSAYTYTVQNSDLFKDFGGETSACFTAGLFNNNGTVQNWVIESIGDASDEEYFSATGVFNTTKNKLNEILKMDLSTMEAVLEAEKALESVSMDSLYSYDRAYISDLYDSVVEAIENAKVNLGVAVYILSYEQTIQEFKDVVEATPFNADAAITLYNKVLEIEEKLATLEIKDENKTRYDAAKIIYDATYTKFINNLETTYEEKVADYETKVAAVVDYTTALTALDSRNAIPSKYNLYLSAEFIDSMNGRIQTAEASYKEKTTITHDNWTQGSAIQVIENADGGLDCISYGASNSVAPTSASGLFNKEKIHGYDFDLSLDIHNLPEKTGAWITLGIMEKPEMWVYAEDESVQDNKGIFFLISRQNATTINVQAFLCTLSSNRFYDSPLNQQLIVPMDGTINISFKEVTKTIAGLEDTYFEMYFNDQSFDQETIPARKFKTALGTTKEGYFIIASDGYDATNPAVFTINSINGVSPTADSIRKTDVYEKPELSNGNLANGEFTCTVDTKGADLETVKVDGVTLTNADYAYENGTLTIKKSYIDTLSAGTHTVEISTKGGTASIGFLLQNQTPETPEKPAGNGCGGTIIASSIILTMSAAIGASLLILKKKKK